MKVFRVPTVDGQGSSAVTVKTTEYYVVEPRSGQPYCDDGGAPSVVIRIMPISQEAHRRIVRAHREYLPNPKTRQLEEMLDVEAITDDLVRAAILDWRGIVGADDQPLVCTDATKIALPGDVKNDCVAIALRGQAAEVEASSFREPAHIP